MYYYIVYIIIVIIFIVVIGVSGLNRFFFIGFVFIIFIFKEVVENFIFINLSFGVGLVRRTFRFDIGNYMNGGKYRFKINFLIFFMFFKFYR